MTALREEIALLTGCRPSLKRARQPDFLLVMYGPEEAPALERAGYTLTALGPRRWGLEPPRAFYDLPPGEEALPWQPGYAWQLYRMAKTHPQDGSLEAVRSLVKALEAGEEEDCCRRLISLCALRLRQRQPLPGYLAGWAQAAARRGSD